MRTLRYVLAGILMLGLAIPAVTLANADGDSDKGRRCSQIGTYFGVVSPEDTTLTGVAWSAMGKSENHGTNLLNWENNPDPSLGGFFPTAVRTSWLRGNWDRTGNRGFVYTLLGYAIDDENNMVGMVRFKGDITHTRDCKFEYITAMVDIYYPPNNPFADDPDVPDFPFPGQWGIRTHVELP